MIVLDFYGAVHPTSEVTDVFQIQPNLAGPADSTYEATVIGGREYRLNLTPVVIGPDGDLIGWPTVQVAHANPAPSERKRDFGSGQAEHFTTTEAGTNGIQLGGGSKIGGGGPVDEVWVHGTMPDGGKIRSQRVKVGLYSSDIVLSPVFQIVKRGSTPPTAPPIATPTSSDAKANLAAAISNISQETLKARDALLRI